MKKNIDAAMLKKFILNLPAVLCLCLTAVPLSAQTAAPSWLTDKELEYPSRRFIAATAEGRTRAEAESLAVAQISLFFNTSTEVRNEAIREFNQAVSNNTTDFSKKTYITENAVIKSEEEFLGVRFANPWLDQKRGVWSALAYINRDEAARIYDSKIAANMAAVSALYDDAARESEALYAAGLLHRAAGFCDITEEYIKIAALVNAAAGKYAADTAKIQLVRSAYRAQRDSLTFNVVVQSPEASGRLERKINSLLEENGCITVSSGGMYTVSAKLTGEEETNKVGNFVTPGLILRVEHAGKALFSYSKSYDRFSHRTSMSTAWTRALYDIEADMEANFITKFTAMIGK